MLTPTEYRLINGRVYDAVPACLYRARGNAQARQLASADWLIRDRRDGRYVATLHQGRARFFLRSSRPQMRTDALAELLLHAAGGSGLRPVSDLEPLLAELGLDAGEYSEGTGLAPVAEPLQLEYAGRDRYRRPLWLDYDAAKAWRRMLAAAAGDGVALDAISGFRSAHYQMGIFRRKLARGSNLADILQVNTAPGFSEHHSGRALDIGTPGQPPAEEGFETTAAFAWLQARAGDFGFGMSYPRGNRHGIAYEPWHWCWSEDAQS
ncbi:MAG: D-alanyl-D-alanine carboxypeptidase family protein [Arenimonas sp.]